MPEKAIGKCLKEHWELLVEEYEAGRRSACLDQRHKEKHGNLSRWSVSES
jgi:hypothetical protein